MAVMTKQDVDKLIREIVGDAIADLRKELEQVNRRYTQGILAGDAPAQPKDKEKGIMAARYLRVMASAKGNPDVALRQAKAWKDEELVKALSETVFEAGGAIVPEEYVAEIIDLLAAKAVVRSLGVETVPMNSGSMTLPFLAQGSSASYVGENQNIPKSEPRFGQLQLFAKKLAALVPISNDLLRDASPSADSIVRNDLVRSMTLREDLAFIRDDGTENKPKGMRYWADPSHVFARTKAGATATLEEITIDLGKAVRLVEEADVAMQRCGWIMTPRTKWRLMLLRDANGNLVFKPEMDRGTLLTYPFKTTTQIPNNLGGGNESEVYFADFSGLVIGENTQLLIDVFPGGAYHDGTNVVSGISADQTVMRAIARHDFGARYRGKEIAVITSVDWGA